MPSGVVGPELIPPFIAAALAVVLTENEISASGTTTAEAAAMGLGATGKRVRWNGR